MKNVITLIVLSFVSVEKEPMDATSSEFVIKTEEGEEFVVDMAQQQVTTCDPATVKSENSTEEITPANETSDIQMQDTTACDPDAVKSENSTEEITQANEITLSTSDMHDTTTCDPDAVKLENSVDEITLSTSNIPMHDTTLCVPGTFKSENSVAEITPAKEITPTTCDIPMSDITTCDPGAVKSENSSGEITFANEITLTTSNIAVPHETSCDLSTVKSENTTDEIPVANEISPSISDIPMPGTSAVKTKPSSEARKKTLFMLPNVTAPRKTLNKYVRIDTSLFKGKSDKIYKQSVVVLHNILHSIQRKEDGNLVFVENFSNSKKKRKTGSVENITKTTASTSENIAQTNYRESNNTTDQVFTPIIVNKELLDFSKFLVNMLSINSSSNADLSSFTKQELIEHERQIDFQLEMLDKTVKLLGGNPYEMSDVPFGSEYEPVSFETLLSTRNYAEVMGIQPSLSRKRVLDN